MYQYDSFDQAVVDARVAQFANQTERFLKGELSEDAYRPLRLQNGLYLQKHAPMLRIAIPYGTLSALQLSALADIASEFDDGYGHFSTRQNLQLNGPRLEQVPAILRRLATVQMHAIQTSGNCIRNVTADHLAGVAIDEVADPRPVAELIRQWSSLHPEFLFLPRKFKIAITGSSADRAAIAVHDIGLGLRTSNGELAFDVFVGGGLGRTPIIGQHIRAALPKAQLLNYLEAILRVYNLHGRRDNMYKARIKILVRELGISQFTDAVEKEFSSILADAKKISAMGTTGPGLIRDETWDSLFQNFPVPACENFSESEIAAAETSCITHAAANPGFSRWLQRSRHDHRQPGYAAISISLKDGVQAPGDCTSAQMHGVASIASQYSFGEIRVTHHQNLVLPYVRIDDLPDVYRQLQDLKLASPNIGLLTDIIACPGGDFCSLANAVSIPIAKAIQSSFDDLDELFEIGPLELNISGCMNSCGHHHIGHIGILGVDKKGESFYQVSIGGNQGPDARLAKILGPSFAEHEIPDVVERLIRCYLGLRESKTERFVDAVTRVGIEPFKEAVYVSAD
ncbi:MAG: nitrite/sulfite reductase [Burkholderiaceae bacterium]